MSGELSVKLLLGVIIANLAYLIGTGIIAAFYDLTAMELLSGPARRAAVSLVSARVTVGAFLGVIDVLPVLGFITTVMRGM